MSRRPRCKNDQCMICSAPQHKLYEPTLASQLQYFLCQHPPAGSRFFSSAHGEQTLLGARADRVAERRGSRYMGLGILQLHRPGRFARTPPVLRHVPERQRLARVRWPSASGQPPRRSDPRTGARFLKQGLNPGPHLTRGHLDLSIVAHASQCMPT